MLRKVDENLWVGQRPLRFKGLAVGSRMTIIRFPDGSLWVHSPLRLTFELRQAVEAIGPPRFLVAPNKYHHLYIGQWMNAWPQARAYAAPGLPEKRTDLSFHTVLSDKAPEEWEGHVELLPWQGAPTLNEVVFFHRASRTLVLTDTAHNLGPETPPFTRFTFWLLGGYGGLRTSLIDRLITRDRAAVRRTLDSILQWDFERIIVAHGHVLETDGAQAFRKAYAWL